MQNLLDQILNDRGQHAEKFKERIAFEVLFEGRDPKKVAEEYQLASLYTVTMWVNQFRTKIKETKRIIEGRMRLYRYKVAVMSLQRRAAMQGKGSSFRCIRIVKREFQDTNL